MPAVAQKKGANLSLNAVGAKVNKQATCQASPLLHQQASLSGHSGLQHTIFCGLLQHQHPAAMLCVAVTPSAQCVRVKSAHHASACQQHGQLLKHGTPEAATTQPVWSMQISTRTHMRNTPHSAGAGR